MYLDVPGMSKLVNTCLCVRKRVQQLELLSPELSKKLKVEVDMTLARRVSFNPGLFGETAMTDSSVPRNKRPQHPKNNLLHEAFRWQ